MELIGLSCSLERNSVAQSVVFTGVELVVFTGLELVVFTGVELASLSASLARSWVSSSVSLESK